MIATVRFYLEYAPHHRREKYREVTRRRNLKAKIEVLSHYGKNGKLQCRWRGCTVKDPDVLTLDHVNDDGHKDRRNCKDGTSMKRWIEKLGWPDTFQTLCWIHQWKKEMLRRRRNRM